VIVVGAAVAFVVTRNGNGEQAAVRTNDQANGSPADADKSWVVVRDFSGTGNETTETFELAGRWRLDWRSEGERFRLTVTGDNDLGTLVREQGPQNGTTVVELGGTYRIEIVAKGAWSITVSEDAEAGDG
jgi:hypothetical protein